MALKVFDLQCESGHLFEGWFASHEDYDQQVAKGWLSCPVCDSKTITKKLSAPRLNLRHASAAEAAPAKVDVATIQAKLLQQLKQVIKNTDDVGDNFAQEARKMHEGESPERAIRGSATVEEYQSLREEGIAVLPIPEFLDEDKLN
ncbi:DUF1178 family protein [Paenalcaligenes sp.]|uniref:DUF1178 family protein n=1 Tax=Paenalcaligenes sp. TaxID=1966342 RepID=UPI0026193876|nr:DUF1178 family protein [Paenalcaligenes sp.]